MNKTNNTQHKMNATNKALMDWVDFQIECHKDFLIDEIESFAEVKRQTWFFPKQIRKWLRDSWLIAKGCYHEVDVDMTA